MCVMDDVMSSTEVEAVRAVYRSPMPPLPLRHVFGSYYEHAKLYDQQLLTTNSLACRRSGILSIEKRGSQIEDPDLALLRDRRLFRMSPHAKRLNAEL